MRARYHLPLRLLSKQPKELKYLYVKEFKILRNIDVNFSHKRRTYFEYKNEQLVLFPNLPSILDFGPALSSVNAIAGQKRVWKKICLLEHLLSAIATVRNGSMGYNVVFDGIVCIGDDIFVHQDLSITNSDQLKKLGYRLIKFIEITV